MTGPKGQGGGATGAGAAVRRMRHDLGVLAAGSDPGTNADIALIDAALGRIEARLPQTGAAQPDRPAGALDVPALLDRLLALAGPRDGPELLRRLDEDLASTSERIALALSGANPDGLRAATHVLISLSGSVGATSIEAQARSLNQQVHDGVPPDTLTAAAVALVQSVGLLRQELTRRANLPDPGGAP